MVARQKQGKVYYFDQDGIYRCVSIEEAKQHKELCPVIRNDESVFFVRELSSFLAVENINLFLLRKCICQQLKIGDSIADLDDYLSREEFESKSKPEEIERFVTNIGTPIFTRVPENPNKGTFDFIFIQVNIISKWKEDRNKYIHGHLKEIKDMVIGKLKSSRSFKKYGVPVNFLRITRVTLKKDSTLEFVMELKTIE